MANEKKALELKKKNVAENVLARVGQFQENGELQIPENYSPANSLKAAWMFLQEAKDKNNKPVLSVCSEISIANALFNMVIDGLSVAKKQCYFIAYGNKLGYQISYFGNLAKAKRMTDIVKVNGAVVYDKDRENFKYAIDPKTGITSIIKHEPKLENIDNNAIAGAYAIVIYKDGTTRTEVMTMAQIKQSWMQGATKGNSPAHRNFPDQMAIRTVINRAIKIDLSSSDDSYLGIQTQNEPEVKNQITEDVEIIDMSEAEDAQIIKEETTEAKEDKPNTPKF